MDPTFKGLGAPMPSKTSSSGPNFKLIFIILGGVLAVVIIASLIIGRVNGDSTALSQRLLYRLDALYSLTSNAQSNIVSDDIAKINSEASLVLAGDIVAVEEVIPAAKSSSTLTAIKTEELDATTVANLKTAKINGVYDKTYTTALLQKLEAAYALAGEVNDGSSSTKVKAALTTLRDHLSTYYTQLKKLQ